MYNQGSKTVESACSSAITSYFSLQVNILQNERKQSSHVIN